MLHDDAYPNTYLILLLLTCALAFSQTHADPLAPTHDTKSAR